MNIEEIHELAQKALALKDEKIQAAAQRADEAERQRDEQKARAEAAEAQRDEHRKRADSGDAVLAGQAKSVDMLAEFFRRHLP